jgi:hypothetical protein
MALTPIDEAHALQIQAGTLGRKAGHQFEDTITQRINAFQYPYTACQRHAKHLATGDPAELLLNYICNREGVTVANKVVAISTGALATSEEGKKWLSVNGAVVSRCKSDLVITVTKPNGKSLTIGVSTKQCNNASPTNAQLYFTTARGFSNLLQNNGLDVSEVAIKALRQFCGDEGYRPIDNGTLTGEENRSTPAFLGGD